MRKGLIVLISLFLMITSTFTVMAHTADDIDFYKAFDNHGSMMLVINAEDGSILYANNAATVFYGYSEEELEHMTIFGINTSSENDVMEAMNQSLSGESNHFTFHHRLADGSIRIVEAFNYPYENGGKTYLISIIYDITEETLAAEENEQMMDRLHDLFIVAISLVSVACFILLFNLRKLGQKSQEIRNFNELRKTFLDADDNIIYLKDDRLRYVFVNRAMEKFHGRPASDIIGRKDSEFADPKFASISKETDVAALAEQNLIVKEATINGHIFKSTKFPVKLENGHFGVGAYISDITEESYNRQRISESLYRNEVLVNVLNNRYSSLENLLDFVTKEILTMTHSHTGCIFVKERPEEDYALKAAISDRMSDAEAENLVRQFQKQPFFRQMEEQKQVIVNNYPGNDSGADRFLLIPLLINDQVNAVILLTDKSDDYDENDIFQVTALMNGVWNAIEKRGKEEELIRANDVLKEKEDQLQLILNSAAEAIYGIDLNGNCTFCNNSVLKLLGYQDQSELIGKNMHQKIHHHKKDGTPISLDECKVYKAFLRGEEVHVDDEVFWRNDGTCFDVEYYSYPQFKDGKAIGAVVTFMDISERKKAENEILYYSYHDALTGLKNRRYFEIRLHELDVKENLPISIIMGDVNGLKLTNDILGHSAGDALIVTAAEAIKKSCREQDVAARWGGDEFIIILPETGSEEAEHIAEAIKQRFAQEDINGFNGSISLGNGTKEKAAEDLSKIIDTAEEKMYLKKTLDHRTFKSTTIANILSRLFQRNQDEEKHSATVCDLCERMGRELNLSASEAKRLKDAAYLHDIGKIVIDGAVLVKEGTLSTGELQELREHPVIGYRILNSFDDTLEIAKYVLYHHERFDGTGYPKGLKGEAIPRISRIIALAESYDFMVTGHQYRNALSKTEAIAEIMKGSGTQFDPKLVPVFLSLIDGKTN